MTQLTIERQKASLVFSACALNSQIAHSMFLMHLCVVFAIVLRAMVQVCFLMQAVGRLPKSRKVHG